MHASHVQWWLSAARESARQARGEKDWSRGDNLKLGEGGSGALFHNTMPIEDDNALYISTWRKKYLIFFNVFIVKKKS